MLEKSKLVQRVPALRDRRVQFVELTDDGLLAMSKWLRYRAALPI
jgi:DNA-binding MarR family transcriptional regulator